MKKILIVLEYELKEYLHNKAFTVMTILLAALAALALFLPRFIDLSGITGADSGDTSNEASVSESEDSYLLFDENDILDISLLEEFFPDAEWTLVSTPDEMAEQVKAEEADAGFHVRSYEEYDYYVYNMGLSGVSNTENILFQEALKTAGQIQYCLENNLDYQEIAHVTNPVITVNEQILGNDTESNYWYSYMLVIVVFILIMMYGQMIAVSVTTEKSNRAIEVLVTSTSPNSLLFGKVIGGAVAGLGQAFIIFAAVLGSYQLNRDVWGGFLDLFLDIPARVLVTFAFFAIGGYLFYGFLYGAVGALVSKTEDISKSSSGLMILCMLSYFLTLMQMFNPDGIVMKILSYLPFSSYGAMFVRVAMGNVSLIEVLLSFALLVVSIAAAGLLGARIYRMGTLRYGNPIKFTSALKEIRAPKEK